MAANNQTSCYIIFNCFIPYYWYLLLLVTYNSKCQMDNVENFLGDSCSQYTLDGNV